MKGFIVSTTLAMVVIVGGGLVITARAQNSTQVVHLSEEKFSLQLGPPSAPAHLTPAQALRAAETLLERWVFTQHPYAITYGSYHSDLSRRTATGLVPVGTRDVWAITVPGLDMQRPDGEVATGHGTFLVEVPPNIHTEVILVDDTTGKYLQAIGY